MFELKVIKFYIGVGRAGVVAQYRSDDRAPDGGLDLLQRRAFLHIAGEHIITDLEWDTAAQLAGMHDWVVTVRMARPGEMK